MEQTKKEMWKKAGMITLTVIAVGLMIVIVYNIMGSTNDWIDAKIIYDNCISKGGINTTGMMQYNNTCFYFTCAFPNGTVKNITIEGIEGLV